MCAGQAVAISVPRGIRLQSMGSRVSCWLLSFCVLLGASPAPAQGGGWSGLIGQADAFYQRGQYDEAIAAAVKALELAQRDHGAEHADVATSLNLLALLYRTKGDYRAAEPLYTRALAIAEKLFGSEHHTVQIAIGNLAELYQAQRRYTDAERFVARALGNVE